MELLISRIQVICEAGNIIWSNHAAKRMMNRGISRAEVIQCIRTGEIIEQYPDWYAGPSCLVYGITAGNAVLHVVVGMVYSEADTIHIVTVYRPSLEEFMPDLKTRRK